MDDLSNLVAQRWREGGPNPAPRPAVPDMAIRYFHVEHLFKAQRLSAELQISCQPMPDPRLVFDGTDRARFDLNCIGAARQSQRLRPQRDRSEYQPSSFAPMVPAVDAPVRSRAPHRMRVIGCFRNQVLVAAA